MNIFNRNCCDGIYHSYDVHFTKFCDNKCSFCIDRDCITVNSGKPKWRAIADTIIENQFKINDVLILGGEPCLFLTELYSLVFALKMKTGLKVYITSSLPKTCFNNQELFFDILEMLDGFNISVQYHKEEIADKIRGTQSQYPRQEFYNSLPYKDKIRINLNLVKGFLDNSKDIRDCLLHYNDMRFNSIKLAELQHTTEHFVSFEKIFDIKLPSPYTYGCQTYIDTKSVINMRMNTPVLLKRSCFLCEKSLTASAIDGIKMFGKIIKKPFTKDNHFGVIYEDGSLKSGWIKGE